VKEIASGKLQMSDVYVCFRRLSLFFVNTHKTIYS